MLPKKYHLNLSYSYKSLPKKSKRVQTKHLSLLVIPRLDKSVKEETLSRFACSVAKKHDKRATRRNRTKRLIMESVYQLLPRVKRGFDVLIFPRKIFWQEKLMDVLPEVEELFKKANLLKEKFKC